MNIAYQTGRIYKISGNYAYMATKSDIFGDYLYTLSDMINVSINTKYIAKYDSAEKSIRPVSADEIKTYAAYGDDCAYAVLRQSRFAAEAMFIYD